MRALVQRVTRASVSVDGDEVAAIGEGLLVLLGVGAGDDEVVADRLAEKVATLRVFDDADGRMNEPLGEREVLCVSQFTLYGDTRKGNRPSYIGAAPPEVAEPLYERFADRLDAKRGVFGARMAVELVNDGPGDAASGSLKPRGKSGVRLAVAAILNRPLTRTRTLSRWARAHLFFGLNRARGGSRQSRRREA